MCKPTLILFTCACRQLFHTAMQRTLDFFFSLSDDVHVVEFLKSADLKSTDKAKICCLFSVHTFLRILNFNRISWGHLIFHGLQRKVRGRAKFIA